MAILLTLASFIGGKYNIPQASSLQTYDTALVTTAINDNEANMIYQIFGVDLGTQIIAYIQANYLPFNADLDFVIKAFIKQSDNNEKRIYQSKGLADILAAYVCYNFIVDNIGTLGQAGVQNNATEIGKQSPFFSTRFAETTFNPCLKSIEAIQWYCRENATDYPKFAGMRVEVKSWML